MTATDTLLTSGQRKLESLLVAARVSPRLFADLILAESGRRVRPHAMHKLMQKLLSACVRERKNLLIQAPPEHAKTSQLIPSLVWLLGHNLKLKIGMVSRDRDLVEENLMRVRKVLISPACASVFPAIAPDVHRSAADRGEWSKTKLYLVDQDTPAFEAFSLFGASEGHRLDFIWADDCVTRSCLYSEAERRQVASALFDTFANRLTDEGIMLVTNNCWHREDAIHRMAESPSFATLWIGYEDVDRMYFRLTHPPAGWDGPAQGTFPLWSQWPRERLVKKLGEPGGAWKRLFQGRAVAPEDTRFPSREAWKRWAFHELPREGKIHGHFDPSGGLSAGKGDFGAIVLVLRRPDGTRDVIDCWVERRPPEEQVAACFTLHEKWTRLGYGGVFRMGIEMLPKDQQWVRKVFETHQEKLRVSGSPYWQLPWEIRPPTGPKPTRIEQIGPPLTHGWLRFPDDLEDRARRDGAGASWRRLTEQLEEWPFHDHDDGPDALAGAIALDGVKQTVEANSFAGVGIF